MNRRTLLTGILVGCGMLVVVPVLLILLVLTGVFGQLPGATELERIQNPLAAEIYSADRVLMGTYYTQNRQYTDPEQITPLLREALIATEDVRFYRHQGIDFRSMGRVLVKSILLLNRRSGGGSTLTQQLAKNLYPREKFGVLSLPVNKIREMIIALRMEKVYSKDEILELYLSTIPFGENTYGIAAASNRFFNKEPEDLLPQQAALLVGLLKATGYYNPVKNPVQARARRNVVLSQMEKYALIDSQEADSLQALPLDLVYNPLPHNAGIAPYFREYLRKELEGWCRKHYKEDGTPYDLYSDGLRVYTTIDSRIQQAADTAVKKNMVRLQRVFDRQWKSVNIWEGTEDSRLFNNSRIAYRDGMENESPVKMKVFTWDGMEEREYNTLDSLRHYLHFLQAGFVAMDVHTAAIKAWVGGINHTFFKYDHVLAKRQAGSTFKPLVYLAALENGISPCELFPNDSVVYNDYENWTPRNADREYGGYYSVKGALVHSVNTVSVQLLMQTGIDSVIALAHRAGIHSALPEVPSLALGTATVSLYEMTSAYQAIANRGILHEPYYLIRIEDKEGHILYDRDRSVNNTAICSSENADIMIEMLREVTERGTGAALRSSYDIHADIAGKTGTTQNNTDGWFIGFTPDLVAGVWVGGDLQYIRFRTMEFGQGSASAMPVWAGFMNEVFMDEQWKTLQDARFEISSQTRLAMDRDDYLESKPLFYKPLRIIKEKRFFRRLFHRNQDD